MPERTGISSHGRSKLLDGRRVERVAGMQINEPSLDPRRFLTQKIASNSCSAARAAQRAQRDLCTHSVSPLAVQ